MLTVRSTNLRRNAATRYWWKRNTPMNAVIDTSVVMAQPITFQPIGPSARMAYLIAKQVKVGVPPFTLPTRGGRA